ncbi:MAG: chorismate mutase [Cyanobacteriota bacterium]|nr:chorismate mutase [Cyanobacteriota bacterium]
MNGAPLRLVGVRGATTCPANTTTDIRHAVRELINALVSRNGIKPTDIVSVTFSVTADLDACFPAAEARQREGWDSVALLDCQQMSVQSDLCRCIRVMAHVWLPPDQTPQHPYLGEASRLRPDRSGHN